MKSSVKKYLSDIGKKGGQSRSERKVLTARHNIARATAKRRELYLKSQELLSLTQSPDAISGDINK